MAVEDSESTGFISGLSNIRLRDWAGLFIASGIVALFTSMNMYMFIGIMLVVFAIGTGYLGYRRQ
jgi:hypothetical protein